MWVRLKLDFGPRDIAHGLLRLSHPIDSARYADAIEKFFSPEGNALSILAVRAGFDLLLGTLAWPKDSEIIYSALNIPDMTMVARHHGIVPVPADLDVDQLAPRIDLIERAITPKTKAILIAHLYGNFVPLDPIIALAKKHGLLLIEDCAENFDGVYTGHPEADISLFSFGPLKTATSLAGGVLRAKDPTLFAKLREAHSRWPLQSRRDLLNRRFERLEAGWEIMQDIGDNQHDDRPIEKRKDLEKEDQHRERSDRSWQDIAGIGGLQATGIEPGRFSAGEVGERQPNQDAGRGGQGRQYGTVPNEAEEAGVENRLGLRGQAPCHQERDRDSEGQADYGAQACRQRCRVHPSALDALRRSKAPAGLVKPALSTKPSFGQQEEER